MIRQSDLGSYTRCPQQKYLRDELEARGGREQTLSATVYGTVVHHALQVFEEHHHAGREDALPVALATFAHYWEPDNIGDLEPGGIDIWLPRQTYGGLREKGLKVIAQYAEMIKGDNGQLLALEYQFHVPLWIDGVQHTLTGTVDRLSRRLVTSPRRAAVLAIEDFKGLATDTPLPTPTGWTTMGAVQVGDRLLGADGLPCNVVAKSNTYLRPCYRVSFDDGTFLVADNVHLWQVRTDDGVQVMDTDALRVNLVNPKTGQRHLRIDNAKALHLPHAALPIDPYVLGAWLGDGHHMRGVISKPDLELFDLIKARGFDIGSIPVNPCDGVTILKLGKRLRDLGVLGNKHVPSVYLRASREQRLDLLRGLMDTDGSWHKMRRRAVFTSCDKGLAEAVFEVVASLGWRPSLFPVTRTGFGLTVQAYDVTFVPLGDNCFALSRKADLVDSPRIAKAKGLRANRRLIVSVEPTITVPTECIQVDSVDSLYLAGHQMVPTHNTGKVPVGLRYNMQFTAYAWASTQREFWDGFDDPQDAYDKTKDWGRRTFWLDMNTVTRKIGGERIEQDYLRLMVALREYARAVELEVYPLNLSGATCKFCPFSRTGECGGVPVVEDDS